MQEAVDLVSQKCPPTQTPGILSHSSPENKVLEPEVGDFD